jgi:hypothetical protein
MNAIPKPEKQHIFKIHKNEEEKLNKALNGDIYFTENIHKATNPKAKTPSPIDKRILATQLLHPELVKVCSDDSDLFHLANILNIKILTGSEFLELLVQNKMISGAELKDYFIKLKSIYDFPQAYRKLEERI